jgi:hypothetical protein
MITRAIRFQMVLSALIDRGLPERYRVDGSGYFRRDFVREHLAPGLTVYDVGGGRVPLLSLQTKQALGLKVVGIDLHAEELAAAPAGVYDATIAVDITQFGGGGEETLTWLSRIASSSTCGRPTRLGGRSRAY